MQRGQSALEYLMTYGWALIVVIVLIAAIVILIPKPAPNCTGFQKLVISNHNLTSTGLSLTITNGTSRAISNANVNAVFFLNESQVADVNYNAGNVSSGSTINAVFNPGTALSGNVKVNLTATYYDGEFNKVEKGNCSGSI